MALRRKVLVSLAAAAVLLTLLPSSASAHAQADYYPTRWLNGGTRTWFFDDGFPTGNKRARVRDAVAAWNNLNQTLTFTEGASADSGFDYVNSCPPTAGVNAIHWRNIPDGQGALGITYTCSIGTEIYSTNMEFDSSRSWYDGTGDAPDGFANQICSLPPGCEWDIWSVAAHEWGHMTGFNGPFADGHFDPASDLCQSSPGPEHTMCPTIEIGTERLRTLELHDRHTFENSY